MVSGAHSPSSGDQLFLRVFRVQVGWACSQTLGAWQSHDCDMTSCHTCFPHSNKNLGCVHKGLPIFVPTGTSIE